MMGNVVEKVDINKGAGGHWRKRIPLTVDALDLNAWTPCLAVRHEGRESHYFQVPLCGYHKKASEMQDCGGQMCELPTCINELAVPHWCWTGIRCA